MKKSHDAASVQLARVLFTATEVRKHLRKKPTSRVSMMVRRATYYTFLIVNDGGGERSVWEILRLLKTPIDYAQTTLLVARARTIARIQG